MANAAPFFIVISEVKLCMYFSAFGAEYQSLLIIVSMVIAAGILFTAIRDKITL